MQQLTRLSEPAPLDILVVTLNLSKQLTKQGIHMFEAGGGVKFQQDILGMDIVRSPSCRREVNPLSILGQKFQSPPNLLMFHARGGRAETPE